MTSNPHGDDRFALVFEPDTTLNMPTGKHRMQIREVAVYFVQDAKIVREEFYYSM